MATRSMIHTAIRGFVFAGVAGLLLATGALAHEEKQSEPRPEIAAHQAGGHGSQMGESRGPRLLMPIMNAARGRKLFASKACVTCHAINGVGGEDAPNLDAHSMEPYMNPFEFAARMWRGAAMMIALQEEALGFQIEFTGDELADIIAFVHDDEEQHKFSEADIPPDIMPMMGHMHGEPGGGAAAHADDLGHKPGHGEDDKHND